MLKVEVNEGNVAVAVAVDDMSWLCADTMTAIHVIYEKLKEINAEFAEKYKKMIVKNVSVAFISDAEVEETIAKMNKDVDEAAAINAEINRLIERLEGLMDCHAD